MQIRKAQKQKAKLRIGLSSPSGGGKTFSSLLIAGGIATNWNKICLIDTESGSGDLYCNYKKNKINIGEYNVITLNAPFSPERYIEAIEACEEAGMEVIIIDSVTHEWEGVGGCLELNEKLARSKFKGNTWSAWSDTGLRHQKFLNKIVQSTCHVVTTVRNKTETAMEGRKVIKVGTKEITREGFEYELTVNFNIDRETHEVIASKDRTSMYEGIDSFIPTMKTGEQLLKWANDGKDIPKPVYTDDMLESHMSYILGELEKDITIDQILEKMNKKYDISDEMSQKIAEIGKKEPIKEEKEPAKEEETPAKEPKEKNYKITLVEFFNLKIDISKFKKSELKGKYESLVESYTGKKIDLSKLSNEDCKNLYNEISKISIDKINAEDENIESVAFEVFTKGEKPKKLVEHFMLKISEATTKDHIKMIQKEIDKAEIKKELAELDVSILEGLYIKKIDDILK